jgi:cysteine-rich repeat protein
MTRLPSAFLAGWAALFALAGPGLGAACSLDSRGLLVGTAPTGGSGGSTGGSGTTGGTGGEGASGGSTNTGTSTAGGGEAPAPECGNGDLEAGEECDDGNLAPGDGCSATCTIEPPFDCDDVIVLAPGTTVLKGSTTDELDHSFSQACGYGLGAADAMHVLEPTIDGQLTLTLTGDFDKVMYVRQECNGQADLDCLAGLGEDVVIKLGEVVAGQQYFVVVDGVGTAAGDFTLTLELAGCGDKIVNFAEECDDGNADEQDGCTSLCAVVCPTGWVKNPANRHCYRRFGDDKSWAEALSACALTGSKAYLAALATLDEVAFVDGAFDQDNVWIGAHDSYEEGKFVWVTGEPFTYAGDKPPWASGEPNDGGLFGSEQCVEIYANASFNDEDCDTKQDYLCELVPPGL